MGATILVTAQVEIPALVNEAGFHVKYSPDLRQSDELPKLATTFEALVVRNRTNVTRDLLVRCKRLKVVGRLGVGLDNIDIGAANDLGVTVVYAPDCNTNAVVEYCLAQSIYASRRLKSANSSTHAGKWDRLGHMGLELRELVFGIVGYGRVGKRLSEALTFLGATVIVASKHMGTPKYNSMFVTLEELFDRAHVLSIHLASSEATRGLIGNRLLRSLRPNAIFINTSRGDVVIESDLEYIVQARPDCTFILDVRATEPPDDRRFAEKDNVVLSPHIAAFSQLAQRSVAEIVFQDVVAVLQGKMPLWPAMSM